MIAQLREIGERFSRIMGRLWLTLLYFTVVLPFGIIARFRAEHRRRGEPLWDERAASPTGDLRDAWRQF